MTRIIIQSLIYLFPLSRKNNSLKKPHNATNTKEKSLFVFNLSFKLIIKPAWSKWDSNVSFSFLFFYLVVLGLFFFRDLSLCICGKLADCICSTGFSQLLHDVQNTARTREMRRGTIPGWRSLYFYSIGSTEVRIIHESSSSTPNLTFSKFQF